jgi:hypothetical protein
VKAIRTACLALIVFATTPALAQRDNAANPGGGTFTAQPDIDPRAGEAINPEGGVLIVDPDRPLAAPGPRYQVRLLSLYAEDETHIDFGSSDEVVTIIRAPGYQLAVNEIGDIDSDGDARRLDTDEQCIIPAMDNDGEYNHSWECDPAGAAAPFWFAVGLYEQDPGRIFGFCSTQWADTDLRTLETTFCETGENNELIGVGLVEIGERDDVLNLDVGQSKERTKKIAYGCDETAADGACVRDDDPIYYITYSVTRMPNAL